MIDIERIFYMIAYLAIENGLEISVEQKNTTYQSKTLGTLATSDTVDNGIVLRVYRPEEDDNA